MEAKFHTNAIHPPADLNRSIEESLLHIIDKYLPSREFIANIHAMGHIYRYLDQLKELNAQNEYLRIFNACYHFYDRILSQIDQIKQGDLENSGINNWQVGLTHKSDIATYSYHLSKIAFRIYQQRLYKPKYEKLVLLDYIVQYITKEFRPKSLGEWQALWTNISPRFDILLQNAFQRATNLGYIPSYFQIINPDNIYVKASRGQVALNRESFETLASFKIPEYAEFIDRIKVSNSVPGTRKIMDNMSYRGGSELKIEGELPINLNENMSQLPDGTIKYTRPSYGWSREKLQQALKKYAAPIGDWLPKHEGQIAIYRMNPNLEQQVSLSLVRRLLTIRRQLRIIGKNVTRKLSYKRLSRNFIMIVGDLSRRGVDITITPEDLDFYLQNKGLITTLPGLGKIASYPREYYEIVYRHMFRTVELLDWSKICQYNLVAEPNIRLISWYDFDVRDSGSLSFKSICAMMSRPRRMPPESLIEVEQIAEPLKLQEGSQLLKHYLSERPSGLQSVESWQLPSSSEYLEPAYQQVYSVCSDLESRSQYEILQLAYDLGLKELSQIDLSRLTKSQLCSLIKRYVDTLREQKLLF